MIFRPSLLTLLLVLAHSFLPAASQNADPDSQKPGEALYMKYCAQCHGESGDGEGVATPYVKPRPRDFTQGKYKIRTTPTGALPTDQDLKDVIRKGMPYTAMPGWPEFSDRQLTNLVAFIKSYYPGFSQVENGVDPIEIPTPPSFSPESAEKGKEIYANLGCARCHGTEGRGDGTSAPTLVDFKGYHIRAADLTQPWTFRGGSSRRDIYRTLMTGINGAPMPSFSDEGALPAENRWALVDYLYSLSDSEDPEYATLAIASPINEEIDLSRGSVLFENARRARFPIVGQIMEPGRNFYPAVTSIEVRSIYNASELAILLEWNDMSAETTGENGPHLKTYLFDPEEERSLQRIAPPEEDAGEDFWGQETGGSDGDPFAENPEPAASAPQSEFSDAVAVQFPTESTSGIRKPYFLFGDPDHPVDLWFVDLADQSSTLYRARGSQSIEPAEGEPVEVAASYRNGRWSVLMKRRRSVPTGPSFHPGEFTPVAFSVWDGFNRERGNTRGLTNWFSLYLEPGDKPSPLGPMTQYAVTILAVELLVIFWVRRRKSQAARQSTPNPQEASL